MRRILFTLIFFLNVCLVYTQTSETKILNINTIADAEQYILNHQEDEGQIMTIFAQAEEESKHLFANKNVGYIVSSEGFTFKILEKKEKVTFKVSYIYFDGKKLSLDIINSKRNEVIKQYKKGINFSLLANQYTMDGNKNGNLDWFEEGMMVTEFENEIRKHKLNDIFTVDIPNEKWYYVVLKTCNETKMDELTLLRIKSGT